MSFWGIWNRIILDLKWVSNFLENIRDRISFSKLWIQTGIPFSSVLYMANGNDSVYVWIIPEVIPEVIWNVEIHCCYMRIRQVFSNVPILWIKNAQGCFNSDNFNVSVWWNVFEYTFGNTIQNVLFHLVLDILVVGANLLYNKVFVCLYIFYEYFHFTTGQAQRIFQILHQRNIWWVNETG